MRFVPTKTPEQQSCLLHRNDISPQTGKDRLLLISIDTGT
jgi:hypothetical protein